MNTKNSFTGIAKLETGIPGFDFTAGGGLPLKRTTLVAGSAGSGKTIFGIQFLAEGIERGQHGLFVTFEEPAEDIRANMLGLGWDIDQWEKERRFAFVDASRQPEEEVITGEYDLGALMVRIETACKEVGAERISLDSLGAILSRFGDSYTIRRELFRLSVAIKRMGMTCVMTAERNEEYGDISRHGVEEFVADNVVVLRNNLSQEKRRRTLEILKFRGTDHHKGEYPFTVIPGEGIVVVPLSAIELKQKSTMDRIVSGNGELDAMCGGGFFRDSILLVTGATGCGKTLMTTEFIAGGVEHDERCLFFAFEESRDQLFRNAVGWGVDFEKMEKEGKLRVECVYPESAGLEDHLIRMKAVINDIRPSRVVVDSLSALERVSTLKGFREFVIALTSFIKQGQIAGLFTATTPTLMGGTSVTEAHISTITDSIILLRYVEMFGEMRRGITVLKMRGSRHEKEIREFSIDDKGMHIGKPFRHVTGIISGQLHYSAENEIEQVGTLFSDHKEGLNP